MNSRPFSQLCAILVLLLASGLSAQTAEMKAGVAKVDITPPLGTRMWGYFDRVKGATGVLDPLYARVLVLEAGGKSLAYPRHGQDGLDTDERVGRADNHRAQMFVM